MVDEEVPPWELEEDDRDWDQEADSYVAAARDELREIFADTTKVQYLRQLEVKLERKFFHWVTARAVNSLLREGTLASSEEQLTEKTKAKFIFHRKNRYHRRRIKEALSVVQQYSRPEVARACGRQAEVLFLNALSVRGFAGHGSNTNEYGGQKWLKSGHDLDFIIEKDGIVYGCEVKNTWSYIDPEEMRIKIDICGHLGIVPLFIMRAGPKAYLEEIRGRGGVFSIFVAQIYPFGMEELVSRIREVLELPVDNPMAIPDGIINRFINRVHHKKVANTGAGL